MHSLLVMRISYVLRRTQGRGALLLKVYEFTNHVSARYSGGETPIMLGGLLDVSWVVF